MATISEDIKDADLLANQTLNYIESMAHNTSGTSLEAFRNQIHDRIDLLILKLLKK